MTALHDLPGTRLLALFALPGTLAQRVLRASAGPHPALGTASQRAVSLRPATDSRTGRGGHRALAQGTAQRPTGRAAGNHQGADRDRWRTYPIGQRRHRPATRDLRRAAGRSAARSRRDSPKTTVPDFGMLSSGLSSFHGVTRNPWNLANNTGGSSSGAAAAAAAGYGPLHLGTDIGGSVRLPAGWCGLVGFKPSLGRIPIDPYTGRCAGPMTRCMDDCLLLMRYLAQPDARDATSLPPEVLDWSAEPLSVRPEGRPATRPRLRPAQPDAEIRAAIDAARLFEEHGAQLRIVEPLMDRSLLDGLNDFWRARLWSELLLLDETRRARVLPYVHAWAEGGARVSGVDAVRGFNQTFEMRRRAGCSARSTCC